MDARDNLLLAALPDEELSQFLAHARPVELELQQVLYEQDEVVDDAYFPTSGAVSLIVELADGRALEPAVIGREGMLGFPLGFGDHRSRWRSVVQVAGGAFVIPRADLREHLRMRGGNLGPLLTHYAGLLITFVAQSAACSQFHSLQQRTARWLLILHDRAPQDDIALTHEILAYMLGVHRPSITLAVEELRQRGLIKQRRGNIHIQDREGLQAATCECYERVERDYRELVHVPAQLRGDGGPYRADPGPSQRQSD